MSCIAKCTLSRTQTRSPDKERREHMEHFLLLIDTLKSRWSVSRTARFLSTHLWPQAYSFQLLQDNKESKRWSAAQKKKKERTWIRQVSTFCLGCLQLFLERRLPEETPPGLSPPPSSSSTFFKVGKDVLALRVRRRLLRASERARHIDKCQRVKKAHALKQLESFTCWFVSKQNFRQKKKKGHLTLLLKNPTTFFSILRSWWPAGCLCFEMWLFFFFNISNLMLLCGWGFCAAFAVVSFLLLYFSSQVASSWTKRAVHFNINRIFMKPHSDWCLREGWLRGEELVHNAEE